ncbi:MAG: rhomboid family intramembrane serine protease [Kiritimatiellae bacterium]|nr:rhomboid family intramembrane serine protease [Kiritimatiellia bacterium]
MSFRASAPHGLSAPTLGLGVRYVLGTTATCFLIQHLFFPAFFQDQFPVGKGLLLFSLSNNAVSHGHVWQFISYAVLHEGFLHFALNMLVVFFLGRDLEDHFGTRSFVLLYVLCAILGGAGWLAMSEIMYSGGAHRCIGASGATFGIIGAFAAAFPRRELTLLVFFVLPVTLTARLLAAAAAATSLVLMFFGGNVAHEAHLAGCIAGFGLTYLWLNQIPQGRTSRARARRKPLLRVMPFEQDDIEDWKRPPEPEAFTEDELNCILEKIKDRGLSSLSKREREVLELASHKD